MQINFKDKYKNEVITNLTEEFNYANPHQVPKLLKIQINQGLGISATNTKVLERAIQEMRTITGRQPIITKAKKSVASFKIREGQPLGLSVTLRRKYMFSFLERLVHLVLPRTRDFRGLSLNSFDQYGNYNFGLTNQLVFPEIKYENVLETRGLNITIVTSAKSKKEGIALLKSFGFPLKTN